MSQLQPLASGSAMPLYRQAKKALLRMLESGELAPGQILPNETELSNALHVSIGTLRKAVDELVFEHILVRRQGKGTFVSLHSTERFMFQFFHVEPRLDVYDPRVVREREYPAVETQAFTAGVATEYEAYQLRLATGAPVWYIDSTLSLSGQVVEYDRIVISQALFKGMTEKRFKERPGTIYQLYETAFGISVIAAKERVRASAASTAAASAMKLRSGTPVLEVHRVASTFGERPVELRICSIHTQQHDYVSELSRG
jgi:GntR family transcriptional regulator